REKIDRVHDCEIVRKTEHSRVVAGGDSDQQIRMARQIEAREHSGQVRRTELTRTTRRLAPRRQPKALAPRGRIDSPPPGINLAPRRIESPPRGIKVPSRRIKLPPLRIVVLLFGHRAYCRASPPRCHPHESVIDAAQPARIADPRGYADVVEVIEDR